jgi:hypothetical protein
LTDADLRAYVVCELGRIIGELAVPMNTGRIAHGLATQLRSVVQHWPDVTVHGGREGLLAHIDAWKR